MSKPWDVLPGLSTDNLNLNLKKPVQKDQERVLGDTFSAFEKSTRPGNRYLVAGFICVVILAGAIGGGLGGGLAAQHRKCPTSAVDDSRTTTTVTVTAALSTATSSSASTSCDSSEGYTPLNPLVSNTPYTINSTNLTYTVLCSSNLPPMQNPSLADIQEIQNPIIPSIYACIDACALYNYQIPSVAYLSGSSTDVPFGSERLCSAVSFGPSPRATEPRCILKTKSTRGPDVDGDEDARFQSAVLVWPDARRQT